MRFIDELAASVFDVIAPRYALLVLLGVAVLSAFLWYSYPAWVPRRLPRLRRLRLPRLRLPRRAARRRRPRPAATAESRIGAAAPPTGGPSAADRLAAQGRFAEAVRERLREIVGELVAAGVVAPQPGWTPAELSAVAATARPAVAEPLHDATAVFSEIWYAQRPALARHDDRMRALAAEIRTRLQYAASSR